MATVEFAGMALVIMALAFGIVEFGSLIQAQAVVTNVTREGGSIASRDINTGTDLLTLLEASTWPLNFTCPAGDATCNPTEQQNKFKIYVVRAVAGDSLNPEPTCTEQETDGTLAGSGVVSPANDPNGQCDLTPTLWDLLRYSSVDQASPLSQFTVVKVYYKHHPVTPLAEMLHLSAFAGGMGGILNFDGNPLDTNGNGDPFDDDPDSFLLSSTGVF